MEAKEDTDKKEFKYKSTTNTTMRNLCLIFTIFCHTLNLQAQIFVNDAAAGLGNGSSWAAAHTDLQTAINAATAGDEIWVAEGIYKPNSHPAGCTNCSGIRDYAFLLKDGVAIYGGFAGTETLLSQRNWTTYPTILSGDIDGITDMVSGSGVTLNITGNAGNARHVVLSLNNGPAAILDGFGIEGGNASTNSSIQIDAHDIPGMTGAGMYHYLSSPTLANIIFSANNAANQGGAMFNDSASPSLTDMTFSNNRAGTDGGGIYNDASAPTMNNIIFTGNRTNIGAGAGVFNLSSAPVMTNMTFTGNYANSYGGGVYNSSSSPTMTGMRFTNNTADTGGAVGNFSDSNPIMTDITMEDNYAGFGGAMYNYTNASPIMNKVTIVDNYAEFYGGGIYNFSSSPVMSNVMITNNYADDEGGGIYNRASSIKITNSSIANNEALNNGGGIFNIVSSPILSNCIVWANAAGVSDGIYNSDTGSAPIITYSIIQGITVYDGAGNMNADPLFVDINNPSGLDGIHRTPDDGLSLSLCSPAIDMGTNDSIPDNINMDIANEARIYANTVDMGAYEPIWTVSFDAIPNAANQMGKATVERTDISGWTHYYDGNNGCEWLLSLNKGTENIGRIGDGTFAVNHETQTDYGTGTGRDLSAAQYVASGSWYVMNRFWTVDVTSQPSSNIAIRFPYHTNDFDDLNGSFSFSDHEDISFYKAAGNTADPHSLDIPASDYNYYINGAAASATTWVYGNPNPDIHYAEYLVSGFSGGSGGVGTIAVLPVELLYFYAMAENQSAMLRWATASEENNKGFHIEHSTDGVSFERIVWVDGNGNSAEEQLYGFTHPNPLDGNNYYRLVQEDFDGTQEISSVEVLYFDKKIEVNVFPNLIAQSEDTFIKFNLEEERQVTAKIYNYGGQLVQTVEYSMTEGNNLEKLEVSNLPSDIYWVNLMWGKRIQSFRLVIME